MNNNARVWFAVAAVGITLAIGLILYTNFGEPARGLLDFGIYSFGCGIGYAVGRANNE